MKKLFEMRRICDRKECQKVFIPNSGFQKYCGDICRSIVKRESALKSYYKNSNKISLVRKIYYQKNINKFKKYSKEYFKENKEEILVRQKLQRKNKIK